MSLAPELIESGVRDGILTLRINRPDKKNALTPGMYTILADGLRRSDSDRDIRVVLITGGEADFTAGNDLSDFLTTPPFGADSPVMHFLLAISEARKPVVAAVNGVAVGVGTTMLLHCDLVFAAEDARFQMPFVNLGLCAEAGSTLLLPRMMGHQRAAELLLLGELFSAKQALQYGLINKALPASEVQETALQAAIRLAAQPTQALQLTKRLMKNRTSAAVRETIVEEGRHFAGLLRAPEAKEAFTAFMEHRKPDFAKIEN
jgi:enoyl-CoA hydratase/carnithine racemase